MALAASERLTNPFLVVRLVPLFELKVFTGNKASNDLSRVRSQYCLL